MTSKEVADLQLLADFVKEWRSEDREWKRDIDNRLRLVEGFVTGATAVAVAQREGGLSTRAKIGLLFSVVSGVVGAVVGVANLLT